MRTYAALALRLALLAAGLVLVWRITLSIAYQGGRDTASHLGAGLAISVATAALVYALLRLDRLSWRDVGVGNFAANLRAFALGAGLWLAPALAGVALCVALGWTSISLRSPPAAAAMAMALLPLALGVFLVEALPEELALRGYAQGLVGRQAPAWVALLAQALLFTAFAWAVGALDSLQQWLFIPGLALILGYARALTGSVWTGIGIHATWMTAQQWMSLHCSVAGMQTLQFLAFALLPSATLGIALGLRHPHFDWRIPLRGPADPVRKP